MKRTFVERETEQTLGRFFKAMLIQSACLSDENGKQKYNLVDGTSHKKPDPLP